MTYPLSFPRRCLPALLIALAVGAAPRAAAQQTRPDARRPSAHIGLTTGLAATWIIDQRLLEDPNYLDVQTYRRAPIGVTFGYHFNDRNGFQIEANKTGQGADFQIIGSGDDQTRIGTKNVRLTYWSVPVLYKYTSGAARRTRFEFHVGPQLNFLSSASDVNRYDRDGILTVTAGRTDITTATGPRNTHPVKAGTSAQFATTDDYRTHTLSAVFGFGVEVKIVGPLYASALVRGTISVQEIRADQAADRARKTGYYTGRQNALAGVQVGLHWQFISPEEGHPKDRPY